jgi:hypothetical protein
VLTTIKVPKQVAAGERYAVLWAQVTSPKDGTHNVAVVHRVGVRVYLDVGPGGEPASDFQIETLTPERTRTGRPEVMAQVRNTGKRALGPVLIVLDQLIPSGPWQAHVTLNSGRVKHTATAVIRFSASGVGRAAKPMASTLTRALLVAVGALATLALGACSSAAAYARPAPSEAGHRRAWETCLAGESRKRCGGVRESNPPSALSVDQWF